jgi:hypothetical protein
MAKSKIKNPTMLSVAAQQAESLVELLRQNQKYLGEIFGKYYISSPNEYAEEFIDNLELAIGEITSDLGKL